MIVWRTTQRIKRGRTPEAVALLKDLAASLPELTIRIYTRAYNRRITIAWEAEYESLEAYDQLMAQWQASPGAAPFVEKMKELGRGARTDELWDAE